jgi:hypothetical protein
MTSTADRPVNQDHAGTRVEPTDDFVKKDRQMLGL